MANKRSRDRNLAKAAARRRMEREAQRRRRRLGIIAGVVVLALVGTLVGVTLFAGGDDEPRADATPSPTPTASPTERTADTITPTEPPANVACAARQPAGALDPKPQFSEPPEMTIDPKTAYTATMATSCGDIVIELDAKSAPASVNSFVFLADQGFYDGTRFHRIAGSIDVIQGGDPLGTGTGGPGYATDDELTEGASYTEGVVAMANSGPDTQGSQFFIVTGPKGTGLDAAPNYTIFGQVTAGLDVAREIQSLPVDGETPVDAVYVESVKVRASG